ncbi:hypothetical protein ACFLXE_00080 [Chloroflexota bacterium]
MAIYGVRARGGANCYKLGVSGSEKILSMHNRDIKEKPIILCAQKRVGDGSLVRDVIDEKRSWDISFRSLPERDEMTVDGGMGAKSLRTLITTSLTNVLVFQRPTEDGLLTSYSVMIDPGSFEERVASRRGTNWKYDVKVSLVEI